MWVSSVFNRGQTTVSIAYREDHPLRGVVFIFSISALEHEKGHPRRAADFSPELLPAEHVDEEVCGAVDADEEVAEVDDPGHPRRLVAPRRAEHHLVQVRDHLQDKGRS